MYTQHTPSTKLSSIFVFGMSFYYFIIDFFLNAECPTTTKMLNSKLNLFFFFFLFA